jgi:hypothetical protein
MYNNDTENVCINPHISEHAAERRPCVMHDNPHKTILQHKTLYFVSRHTIRTQSREMVHTFRTKTDIPAHFVNILYVLC